MNLKSTFTALLFFIIALAKAQTKPETLSNKNIIELVKVGLSDDVIVRKINASSCNFDLSTNGLVSLKTGNVSAPVMQAMMDKADGKKTISVTDVSGTSTKSLSTASHSLNSKSANGKKINLVLLNHIHTYNDSINPLEKKIANSKTKSKALGYGGVDYILEIDEITSPIKVTPEKAFFIIKTGGETPPDLILYKLKVSKKTRSATLGKYTMGGMKGSEGGITLNISKVQDGVFKIVPTQALEKGEYFFLNRATSNAGTNSEVYAFSVI